MIEGDDVSITAGCFETGIELRGSEIGAELGNSVGLVSVGVGVIVLDMFRKADGDPVESFLLGKNVLSSWGVDEGDAVDICSVGPAVIGLDAVASGVGAFDDKPSVGTNVSGRDVTPSTIGAVVNAFSVGANVLGGDVVAPDDGANVFGLDVVG
jgi:hypothetical protein